MPEPIDKRPAGNEVVGMTFEEWKRVWYGELFENHDRRDYALHCAEIAWNARQPEIDLLTRKLETARRTISRANEYIGLPIGARRWLQQALAAIDADAPEAQATEPSIIGADAKLGFAPPDGVRIVPVTVRRVDNSPASAVQAIGVDPTETQEQP